jgi:hypothetical protein
VLGACTSDRPVTNPASSTTPGSTIRTGGGGPRVGRFQPFQDCSEFLGYVQEQALPRVTAYGLVGSPMYDRRGGGPVPTAEDSTGGKGNVPASGDPGHSTTTTQEAGVDEGDIVETDGRYVYSVVGPSLLVTDVDAGKVVEQVPLVSNAFNAQLLLDTEGQRLAVVEQRWTGSISDAVVTLYDVSDPAALRRVSRTHLEGAVVAARAVDGVARLVVTTPLGTGLHWVQPGFALDDKGALARNQAIVRASTETDWLPRRFDEATDGTYGAVTSALACDQIGNPEQFSGLGISWVASLDLRGADQATKGATGVVATGEQVYASPASLYVATIPWDYQACCTAGQKQPTGPPPTAIHQFELTAGGGARYVASGTVTGSLLSSYSMSEYDGVLRVATTEWADGFGTQQRSGVHTFRAQGDQLVELGSVIGLGKDQQIQAVRFIGSLGYVVTFRQTDPLYVIDLRDPSRPVVAGQLEMPGFSSYLAPVADGYLVGVGADATAEGRITGGQISLFDVRDPAAPKRLATIPIGTGQSEAGWDPHAFLYWPADGSIVLPTSYGWMCPQDQGCPPDYDGSNAALVINYADGTLTLRGAVTQPKSPTSGQWCWWGPGIRRSLVLGDRLVTLSERGLMVNGLTDLAARQWIPFRDDASPCDVVRPMEG